MSNALAIAAVTSTVRNMLVQGLSDDATVADTVFTTLPPDKARTGTTNQLNLFLYQMLPNAAWSNQDFPPTRNGNTGWPALSLDLHYLLTAYGRNEDDVQGHHVLGLAMGVLHDSPVLDPTMIRAALADNDLDLQPERVRITAQPLTLDELSKLWTAFQTQYRVSAAYRASVVLIQSALSPRAPLPVLQRSGTAQGNLDPPFPALSSVELAGGNPSARLGDTVTLRGTHLSAATVEVNVMGSAFSAPVTIAPSSATDTAVSIVLPDDAAAQAAWPVGMYAVSITLTTGGDTRETSQLPFSLAPKITAISPDPAPRDGSGAVQLTVSCMPKVGPRQRAELLLGGRVIPAAAHAAPTSDVVFDVPGASVGTIPTRLRVDGIESLLVDRSTTPPAYDATQQVTVE